MIIVALIILFYLAIIIGSICLLIWAITTRIKEKKREEIEHKDYKNY
ncbi:MULTISPECIES: hypothetical protein [Clostridium]|uniref:Uncharacterized protein n=1 Tax=Clostridium disporicum TaxID=84024 RepID=A0A174KLE8_9CLOT|nr:MULTISPECIES: hypothetical protein [Clostridium]MCD2502418.1 hypothetical protein [Clostridium sp. NSJ-145]MDU6341092.1 hypothetical protein [Clostridium sp.]CUP10435.1 Uncharacterised protein [Clostridium disporicum]